MADQKWDRDDDGNIIDPPTLPDHEAKLQAASVSADNEAIAQAQEDYDKAREDYVARAEARQSQDDRAKSDSTTSADNTTTRSKSGDAKTGDK